MQSQRGRSRPTLTPFLDRIAKRLARFGDYGSEIPGSPHPGDMKSRGSRRGGGERAHPLAHGRLAPPSDRSFDAARGGDCLIFAPYSPDDLDANRHSVARTAGRHDDAWLSGERIGKCVIEHRVETFAVECRVRGRG